MDDQAKLDLLFLRLETIEKKQVHVTEEIVAIRREIDLIKMSIGPVENTDIGEAHPNISESHHPSPEDVVAVVDSIEMEEMGQNITQKTEQWQEPVPTLVHSSNKKSINFEKLIGENLINKIGIAITVIGVAIGAKYSIDNNLINPLTRIILGYLMGVTLIGIGMKLKQNYINFSAVLVSGGMAIMYFITYAAYGFYQLFPIEVAFGMMVLFTVFTVATAIHYDKQIIAHIGLVGAYAVPFLLSEGSGKVLVLFSYVTVINVGILVLAFQKYWKALYYVAFVFTWMLFLSWYSLHFDFDTQFGLGFLFLAIFFATFYIVFLAYKLVRKERFEIFDIMFLSVNSFLFYGIGYSLLNTHADYRHLLGLFTLANGVIHFAVTVLVYRMQMTDRSLLYFIAGLVLIFITMAIPVQLDGHWVTIIWSLEALLLFWIGRTKNLSAYEFMSYPLMVLAVGSLTNDWDKYKTFLEGMEGFPPIFNETFMTFALVIASFISIYYLHTQNKSESNFLRIKSWRQILTTMLGITILLLVFVSFQLEISYYWEQSFLSSKVMNKVDPSNPYPIYDQNMHSFGHLWSIYFSLVFACILLWGNLIFLRNKIISIILCVLTAWAISSYLTVGLYDAGELRSSYLNGNYNAEYFEKSIWQLVIRYLGILLMGCAFFGIYITIRSEVMGDNRRLKIVFDLAVALCTWILLSNELYTWEEINHVTGAFKLGMSILWGIIALSYIIFGMWQRKKHIRIFAIALFTLTLIKLFLYDISHISTISKTIIFITLGILLLITSFLYNKYNNLTDGE